MSEPSSTAAEDGELMRRLQDGDDLALNDLMGRWGTRVLAFTKRYLSRHADAVDAAEEVFVKVYHHRHRYREGGMFASWLFAIAANLCRNHHRWQARHPGDVPGDDEPPLERSDGRPSPAENASRHETAKLVREAVQSLPHDLRVCVLLSEYEGQSHSEIGAALGCTAKAVETRLYRARQLLKDKLGFLLD
jgi:RNA polymerase sigma-70 factor (ECF subfamily)